MRKNKDKADQLNRLTEALQHVRQESLAASRRGDFRGVARLTGEAARLNRMILAAEGAQVTSLIDLGDKLFTGDTDDTHDREHSTAGRELALA